MTHSLNQNDSNSLRCEDLICVSHLYWDYRFGDPPSRKSWGSEEDVGGSTFPPPGNREDRVGDFPKGGWGRIEERVQSWDHGSRSHDWNKDFELEPATVVDYGHRPAAVPGLTGECVLCLLDRASL